jgi:hypothetical protein
MIKRKNDLKPKDLGRTLKSFKRLNNKSLPKPANAGFVI